MAKRLVYYFGHGHADGGREQKELLGGKGANLGEMVRIGVPVPPGFTITTEVCRLYLREGRHPTGLKEQVADSIRRLEHDTGKSFGGEDNPLLVSVRSGAAVSMPGMMDTILNLGLNNATVAAIARAADNERFAFDSYRRFVQMYGDVVLGIPARRFDALLRAAKKERGVVEDTDLTTADLRDLVSAFKELVLSETGRSFPEDPQEQLWGAINAVFDSWNNDRAITYRRVSRIPEDLGTAVSVLTMVYGNMGDDSGTGVAFTRDPATGEKCLFGEFLLNAQGEDVVAGVRDPLSIDQMAEALPEAFEALMDVQDKLERHYRDMQDIEFTVERGRLYLLQTRTAKRTAASAVRVAVEMVDESLIVESEAVLRVEPTSLEQLLHPRIDPDADVEVIARGLPASPGAQAGRVVFDSAAAIDRSGRGEPVILVREETSPEDFEGMIAAGAILTARGGMTSHAAVVARGIGKCCIVGAREIEVDEARLRFSVNGTDVREGDWITVDGSTGRVLSGRVPTVRAELSGDFTRLMGWADEFRRLAVRTNADTPADAARGREFGAEGIGLCRTEHMFFEGDRIDAVREMILADDEQGRRRALDKLLPMQREDFTGIFRAMDGLPVTVRLLDPPLHEFLPRTTDEIRHVSHKLQIEYEALNQKIERLRESNPMLGHRGVRLAITFPEIAEMQVRAIFEAALIVAAEGVVVRPEVMVPLVSSLEELRRQRELIRTVAGSVLEDGKDTVAYTVGTMIELPRAALIAGVLASEAEFFSFGTNDLTQTTFGISRDDAATFLPLYMDSGILGDDPFQSIDRDGVGRLVEIAVGEGRSARTDLKLGICGEHGGDPASVRFFHDLGLDYVSCSPYRVPVARLAAAHAALSSPAGTDAGASRHAERTGTRGSREPVPAGDAAAGGSALDATPIAASEPSEPLTGSAPESSSPKA